MTPAAPEIRINTTPDPQVQGREIISSIVERGRAAGKTADQIREDVTNEVKRDIESRTNSAEDARDYYELRKGIEDIDQIDLSNVAKSMNAFMEALRNDWITPPTHNATRVVFDNLKIALTSVNARDAGFLQPLVHGILNTTDYIDPTRGSRFYNDLEKMIPGFKDARQRNLMQGIFFNPTNPIPGNITDFQNRFTEIIGEKTRQTEKNTKKQESRKGQYTEQEDQFLRDILTDKPGSADAEMAEEILNGLLENLDTGEQFYNYYQGLYIKKLKDPKYPLTGVQAAIDSLEKKSDDERRVATTEFLKTIRQDILEEVRRDTTMEIHQMLQFLTHRIFAGVIEHAGHGEWRALVSEARQGWIDPGSVFRKVTTKLVNLGNRTPLFSKENIDENAFYQLGIEKVESREVAIVNNDDGTQEISYSGHKTVEVLTSELEKVESFKEFFERFNTAMQSEVKFLEVGNNFIYLMHHGAHEGSFFENAAKYSRELSNARLDELYRLPNADIIHAARIALASQFKRQLARNKWMIEPDMFSAIFHHADTGQHHVLVEMIRSNLVEPLSKNPTAEERAEKIGSATPEWAIRRALIHARMHMALVSVDFHALSSYAHPPLGDDLHATYKDSDQILDKLETFRTWFDATKWETSELQRYGMAFYPAPNRKWAHDIWLPEDIKAEGQQLWIDSKDIGSLSLLGRTYTRPDTPLNINELNPMGVNGVERMSGWGLKDPYMSWIQHLINSPESVENFHLKHKSKNERGELTEDSRDFELAWKNLENLGTEVLNNYKESFLFGVNNKFLKLESNGRVKTEKHYENFYKFLFDRYFKTGIGKESLGMSFRDYRQQSLPEVSFQYSQFANSQEFWEKVVEPILNRPDVYGEGEKPSNGKKRNQSERAGLLKKIVEQALGVIIFERLPMDMVYTEDPLISQNGMTFIEELARQYERPNSPGTDHHEHYPDDGKMTTFEFEHALMDIEDVQATARLLTIRLMKDALKGQRREKLTDKQDEHDKPNPFGNEIQDIYKLRSTIAFSKAQLPQENGQPALSPTGYVIDEHIIRDLLTQKYNRMWNSKLDPHLQPDLSHVHIDPNLSEEEKQRQIGLEIESQKNHATQYRVENAVKIYKSVREKMAQKPDISFKELHSDKLVDEPWAEREIKFEKERGDLEDYEKTPEIIEERMNRIKEKLRHEFEENRSKFMQSRLAWSTEHLLDPKMPLTINDMAYNFVYFSSTGANVVNRRLAQIAATQEQYKAYIMGDYDSDLKKYYRKEDFESLLKNIIKVRSGAKAWIAAEAYNGIATFILENSINVMRIRSDAENALVEMQYRMEHKSRAGISPTATEGEEFPLHRQDRNKLRVDFAHDGQTPKRAKEADRVYKVEENLRRKKITNFTETFGTTGKTIGELIADVADTFLGEDQAGIIRNEMEELSTDAGRLRDFSSIFHILTREGPTIIGLLLAALLVLSVVQGYRASEEK